MPLCTFRLRFRQHHGIAPLVHYVGHRHLAPAVVPGAVGVLYFGASGHAAADGLRIPFYFEYELRARHPRGVIARLRPYTRYYHSNEPEDDQPPYPVTLFVVDTEEVEAIYVRTAARMSRLSLPIFVSCIPVLSHTGILGRSWRPLWEPESPRLPLSALSAYHWDSLYHRMRQSPVGGIDRADTSLSPSVLSGGYKWHNRADFQGSPTAKSPLF